MILPMKTITQLILGSLLGLAMLLLMIFTFPLLFARMAIDVGGGGPYHKYCVWFDEWVDKILLR